MIAIGLALAADRPAWGYQVNERFTIEGSLAAAGQCALDQDSRQPNLCRGAVSLMPNLRFAPTERDQFLVAFNFALGNSLNSAIPFAMQPWAATLENGVKDINGSGRDYLTEAWYAHTFMMGRDNSLQLTAGILDSQRYLDTNAYAGDPITQFMNAAFVNSYRTLMPSYDLGVAAVWQVGDWSVTGLGMQVHELDRYGMNYVFAALQIGYRWVGRLGEGNYRVIYDTVYPDIVGGNSTNLPQLARWTLSFDQALGKSLGAFLRVASLHSRDLFPDTFFGRYTLGLNLAGTAWGRGDDQLGLALGFSSAPRGTTVGDGNPGLSAMGRHLTLLNEFPELGNASPIYTRIAETYYRLAVSDSLALTADIQYLRDTAQGGNRIEGWIIGLRAVLDF